MLRSFLLSLLVLLLSSWTSNVHGLKESTMNKIQSGKKLNRQEKQEVEAEERESYIELRKKGYDEVSDTQESTALRNYRLRKRKRIGIFQKRQTSLSQIFFPGSHPTNYDHEFSSIVPAANLMRSRRSLEAYDISRHPAFYQYLNAPFKPTTLGAKLEGYSEAYKRLINVRGGNRLEFPIKTNVPCTILAISELPVQQNLFLQKLIQLRYRIHLMLDDLPMLMRSREWNYAVKGMPIGFEAPLSFEAPSSTSGRENNNMFLYNHWRFTVTYHEDPTLFEGIRITGFDVLPVSFAHSSSSPESLPDVTISTCASGAAVENHPDTYLALRSFNTKNVKPVTFSYEVEWVQSELTWDDRWDVYFLELPDDAIHYFSMFNSVICMAVLMAVIATALIRIFRKDLAGGTKKENGWKHLKGDVFRKPESSPMLLSVMVGNGLHILVASILTMLLNILHIINTMEAGDALTGLLFVYALTSSLGGYVSTRLYKLCGGQDFKANAIVTSTVLSGSMVLVFCLFNMVSDAIGSSCSDALSVLELILLWGCISANLTYWGAQYGERAPCMEVPTETSDIARPIPDSRWLKYKKLSPFVCGMICFGVLYVELHFLMMAVWHQATYLGLGYMLIVLVMATIVCAEITVCVAYYQLNMEDHRWWWTAFWNGSSVAGYMVIHSIYYRFKQLELVGLYSNLAYFTCMFFATVCVGIVFGSIGVLSCLWFTKTIYGTVGSDAVDEDEEVVSLKKEVSEHSVSTDTDDSE